MRLSELFEKVVGQEQAVRVLESLISQDKISHAYLFCGPASADKLEAAYAFAQAVVCGKGACGECENCTKAAKRKHPDVHVIEPEGAKGFLIAQIRDIVADASLAPILAKKKVYIINGAELLNDAAANAFLKTLEEPPESVVIIMLAAHADNVLATIASRCLVVHFRAVPENEAFELVRNASNAPDEVVKSALFCRDGSVSAAIAFCHSNDLLVLRKEVLKTMAQLFDGSEWQLLKRARALCELATSELDELKSRQEQERAQAQDFLSKAAYKQLEEKHKRQQSALALELFSLRAALVKSWLHDVLMQRVGCCEQLINTDFAAELAQQACCTNEAAILRACKALERFDRAIKYNVNPKLCMDTLLLEIREELYDPDIAG